MHLDLGALLVQLAYGAEALRHLFGQVETDSAARGHGHIEVDSRLLSRLCGRQ